jgi:hypothetical protein
MGDRDSHICPVTRCGTASTSLHQCLMKTLLIALSASVSLFFAGCGKEPARVTSESPSPSPQAIVPGSNTPATSPSSVSETAVTSETAPTPSASATAKIALAFKTEAATKAATEYLNAYSTLINDINARTTPRGADPETAISNGLAQLQRIAEDNAEVAKHENRVQQALTPEEVQRLLQYRKSLEESAQTSANDL